LKDYNNNMFSKDDFNERRVLSEKIEIGIRQSENGEVITEAEIETEIKKWFVKTELSGKRNIS